ncbi:uncharacterized protein N7487_004430 [Penicillium crustosum]|uniref:uncharacterized protein n=1 Tax=Penicillium crustosum TaxID=36656 RepID=UPI00238261F4|nr:uncharacterized protein N7487_004430 [Penicillium crustosum]KAJ5410071.1 hypothetical protein N7487_004430 [Penicillium crustosum]
MWRKAASFGHKQPQPIIGHSEVFPNPCYPDFADERKISTMINGHRMLLVGSDACSNGIVRRPVSAYQLFLRDCIFCATGQQ